jgi:hypothetical protein
MARRSNSGEARHSVIEIETSSQVYLSISRHRDANRNSRATTLLLIVTAIFG